MTSSHRRRGEKGKGGVCVIRGLSYNGGHTVRLEKSVEILQELQSEQGHRLSSARKDIVDYVVKLAICLVDKLVGISDRISNYWRVVGRQLEVFGCEFMHNRIDLDHRGVNPVCDEGGRCCSNTKTAGPLLVRIPAQISLGRKKLT